MEKDIFSENSWADDIILNVLCTILQCKIYIFKKLGFPYQIMIPFHSQVNESKLHIHILHFSNGNHFNLIKKQNEKKKKKIKYEINTYKNIPWFDWKEQWSIIISKEQILNYNDIKELFEFDKNGEDKKIISKKNKEDIEKINMECKNENDNKKEKKEKKE